MTIKPAAWAAMLLYAAGGQVVLAVDAVGGDKAATIGAAALIAAVATAAGGLLARNMVANKQLFEQAMAQLEEERHAHAQTRERLDRVEAELWELRRGVG